MNSIYAFVVLLFLVSGYAFFESKSQSEVSIENVNISVAAKTFVIYKEAMQTYVINNPSYTGSVSGQVTLPTWLSKRNDIQMYAENGKGYVYIPLQPGLMKELMIITDSSSAIGVTDSSSIKITGGVVAKPAYIPANYVVYIL